MKKLFLVVGVMVTSSLVYADNMERSVPNNCGCGGGSFSGSMGGRGGATFGGGGPSFSRTEAGREVAAKEKGISRREREENKRSEKEQKDKKEREVKERKEPKENKGGGRNRRD